MVRKDMKAYLLREGSPLIPTFTHLDEFLDRNSEQSVMNVQSWMYAYGEQIADCPEFLDTDLSFTYNHDPHLLIDPDDDYYHVYQ